MMEKAFSQVARGTERSGNTEFAHAGWDRESTNRERDGKGLEKK